MLFIATQVSKHKNTFPLVLFPFENCVTLIFVCPCRALSFNFLLQHRGLLTTDATPSCLSMCNNKGVNWFDLENFSHVSHTATYDDASPRVHE